MTRVYVPSGQATPFDVGGVADALRRVVTQQVESVLDDAALQMTSYLLRRGLLDDGGGAWKK